MGRRLPCLRIRSCSTWKALVFGAGKNDALTLNSQSVRHIRPNTEKTFSTNRKWRDVMGSSGILPHLPGEGCQFLSEPVSSPVPPPPRHLNRQLLIAVGTAGPQPPAPDRSGQNWTSTASSRSQWAGPDLNTQPHNTQSQTHKQQTRPQTHRDHKHRKHTHCHKHTTTTHNHGTQPQAHNDNNIFTCVCVCLCVCSILRGRWSQGSTFGCQLETLATARREPPTPK